MSKKKQVNELLNEIKLTDEEIISNDRYRHFVAIIYEESDYYDFDDVMFNLRGFKYYAYIKHEPESNEKQAHYHLFISLDSATTIQNVARRLGIPANYIQFVRSVRSSVRYLTHIDYPEKIQYKLEDVVVSGLFQRKFRKQFEDIKTESDILNEIYTYITTLAFMSFNVAQRKLVLYINENCYDTIYKRYRYEFTDYLRYVLQK